MSRPPRGCSTRLGADDWPALARLDAGDLRSQLAARRADGLGNVSAARELSALKAFLAFAREQAGHADAAPPRLRGPRIKKGLPRPVTPDEAVNLADAVAAVGRRGLDRRARPRGAAADVRRRAAHRRGAVARRARTCRSARRCVVTGKGGKQRVVPLLPIVRAAVADYAARCPWPLLGTEPLFRGAKGGPLGQGMVQKAMARARIALGLPATATPHALAPQLRHAPARRRRGLAQPAGTARPRQPRLDADLHQGRRGDAARHLSRRAPARALVARRAASR